MKTTIAGIIALLLLTGFESPRPSLEGGDSLSLPADSGSTSQDAISPGTGAVGAPVAAPVPPSDAQDSRPIVRMYAPESCSVCDALLSEIEKVGEASLPFRVVKWPLEDWMVDGPWFYWQSGNSSNGWMRLRGLQTLNGKRLDYLLREWLETQPDAREVASQGQDGVHVCCCKGTDTEACLCVEEIRKGTKRGPCTCNARFGSRHYVDANGNPTGPAGGYRELAIQTPVVRIQSQSSYCPNCRR